MLREIVGARIVVSTLFVVATPIGNLEDITLRALRVLREVGLIAAEDTRSAHVLLSRHDIATPLTSYTDAYDREKQPKISSLLAALQTGDVALISEAGMPTISDPGFELVKEVLAAGHQVVPIPGPSAIVTALAASGLPTEPFRFVGFLPRRKAERRDLLASLADEDATVVAFETPHRLREALADLVAILGSERPIAIAREITKLHEEFWRGSLADAEAHFTQVKPRGEFTLVIGSAAKTAASDRWTEQSTRELLRELRQAGLPASAVARIVARLSHRPRQTLYEWVTSSEGDED